MEQRAPGKGHRDCRRDFKDLEFSAAFRHSCIDFPGSLFYGSVKKPSGNAGKVRRKSDIPVAEKKGRGYGTPD